jgi:hypothetical protein
VKPPLKGIVKFVLVLFVVAFVVKAAQTVCWRSNVSIISPPSLDSWDPTERVEAAWQAAKKYGGEK